jgi:peptidyl-tRNA hydrolase, PTH2 family
MAIGSTAFLFHYYCLLKFDLKTSFLCVLYLMETSNSNIVVFSAAIALISLSIGYLIGRRSASSYRQVGAGIGILEPTEASSSSSSMAPPDEELKMILVVRTDLGMKRGKSAAQCCHAALGVYGRARIEHPDWTHSWETWASAKVTLKANSEEELRELQHAAQQLGISSYLVQDAGRTQIAAGSRTVLGLGPAPRSIMDKVTGHLKLY